MKKNTARVGLIVVTLMIALAFVGCATGEKRTSTAPKITFGLLSALSYCGDTIVGNGSVSCVGSYTAFAYITNNATTNIWFTPPVGTTNCTITDSSGLASPYVSVVKATRKDGPYWCGTNAVSFPATSAKNYRFTIYIKNSPPPPTNGQMLTLDVQWQP